MIDKIYKTSFTPDKILIILIIIWIACYVITFRCYELLKMSKYFVPPWMLHAHGTIVSCVTCTGVDVISVETIMNPIQVTDDDDKGKSIIRSPEVVTFSLSLRYVNVD